MKIKTTGFWISLCSAVVLLIQTIANAFGFKFDAQYVNEIVTSVCGVLVVIGVLIPSKTESSQQSTIVNDSKKDADMQCKIDVQQNNNCDSLNQDINLDSKNKQKSE